MNPMFFGEKPIDESKALWKKSHKSNISRTENKESELIARRNQNFHGQTTNHEIPQSRFKEEKQTLEEEIRERRLGEEIVTYLSMRLGSRFEIVADK